MVTWMIRSFIPLHFEWVLGRFKRLIFDGLERNHIVAHFVNGITDGLFGDFVRIKTEFCVPGDHAGFGNAL